MEGHCSTGQSPQWAVAPMEEEEEENRTSGHTECEKHCMKTTLEPLAAQPSANDVQIATEKVKYTNHQVLIKFQQN